MVPLTSKRRGDAPGHSRSTRTRSASVSPSTRHARTPTKLASSNRGRRHVLAERCAANQLTDRRRPGLCKRVVGGGEYGRHPADAFLIWRRLADDAATSSHPDPYTDKMRAVNYYERWVCQQNKKKKLIYAAFNHYNVHARS